MFFERPLKSHIAFSSNPNNLKEYSVILTTSFYDMNEQILTKKKKKKKKKKKLISKISVDTNFTFTSYAWLCAVALLHRLPC